MKNKILPTIILVTICMTVTLLLSAINTVTEPIIAAANEARVQAALSEVLPTGENFVEISTDKLAKEVIGAYTEDNGGYVFQIEVTGYKSGLKIMCGINADGKISGASVIASKETLSAEKELGSSYVGKDASNLAPEIVTSATLTSNAYHKAVQIALESFKALAEKEGIS